MAEEASRTEPSTFEERLECFRSGVQLEIELVRSLKALEGFLGAEDDLYEEEAPRDDTDVITHQVPTTPNERLDELRRVAEIHADHYHEKSEILSLAIDHALACDPEDKHWASIWRENKTRILQRPEVGADHGDVLKAIVSMNSTLDRETRRRT